MSRGAITGSTRVYVDQDVRGDDGRLAIPRGSEVELIIRTTSANDLIIDLESVVANRQRYAIKTDAKSESNRSETIAWWAVSLERSLAGKPAARRLGFLATPWSPFVYSAHLRWECQIGVRCEMVGTITTTTATMTGTGTGIAIGGKYVGDIPS